jgi:hypothetical protein
LPELTVNGQFFSNGDRWTAIQCSDFNLLNLFLSGEDITPVLQQRQSCGFNLLRVWTLYDIPGIGTLTQCDYSRIPAFVSLCASYGLYVEFCAYTGINDPWHWSCLCLAALICQPRPLLELVNELDQNLNEPDSQGRVFNLGPFKQAMAPLLSSHGSNGSEHWPVIPYWSYATMHFNDAYEWQRKTGHNSMEVWSGPTLANENTRYDDRTSSDIHANDAAVGAALLCAGSCFHSVCGKTSELWDGNELVCARAWATGARSVPLVSQVGAYRHASELEDPGDLRVYQRVLSDGSSATVRIRR